MWNRQSGIQPDAIVLAGDLFSAGWEEEQRAEAQNIIIIPSLKRISAPVLYITGNDDNVALEYEDEQIRPFHGRRLSCGDFYFAGYQFTPRMAGTFGLADITGVDRFGQRHGVFHR